MSTSGEACPDVHALIKELTIRREEHGLEIHPNESQHLTEGRKQNAFGGDFLLFRRRLFSSVRDIISADRERSLWAPNISIYNAWYLR